MSLSALSFAVSSVVSGVAAVSFAAWTGSNTTFTATANTGDVNFLGFTGNTTGYTLDPLVPWNQNPDYIKEVNGVKGAKIVSKQLPAYDAYGNYTVTVESDTELGIYVFVGAAQTTAVDPTSTEAVKAGWKSVSGSNTAVFNFNDVTDGAQTTYISVLLVSDDYANDHGQEYSLTVKLAEVLPTA